MAGEDIRQSRIWVVSELYYPEDTSTGYYLTRIAEGLAEHEPGRVNVLCGRPSYAARGIKTDWRETHQGVDIRRCWATRFPKDRLLLRLVNLLTLSLSIFLRAVFLLRRGDRVLVVTNPPLLPFVVSLACRLRGGKCVLLIHDVYPDVAVVAGLLRHNSLVVRAIDRLVIRLYRRMDRIVVLGRDMRNLAAKKLSRTSPQISVIPNWADWELVSRAKKENAVRERFDLEDKFVVQYSGNMGRTHNLDAIVQCAASLRDHHEIHFLLVGSGAKKPWLEHEVRRRELSNVTIADRLPREELPDLLTAGDIALITFVPGMAGISVPSRLYNMLAAGTPIVALTDANSEVAQVLEEDNAGIAVLPQDAAGFSEAILELYFHRERRLEMSQSARRAAESKYRYETILEDYCQMMAELDDEKMPITATAGMSRAA